MTYVQLLDGTIEVDGNRPSIQWRRVWTCFNSGKKILGWCRSEDDCPCPCRGPVTDGHDPGDEDRK